MRTSGVFGFLASSALGLAQGDKLIVPDVNSGGVGLALMPLSVAGAAPVTGMQFEVEFVPALLAIGPALAASVSSNHYAESREVAAGRRRVVIYSRSNALLPKDVVVDLPIEVAATAGNAAPLVQIKNLCFTKTDGTKVTPAIQRGPIADWFFGHFSLSELTDPVIFGDSADPDMDGMGNLMEYAVTGDPHRSDSQLGPVINALESPAGGVQGWELTFFQGRHTPGVALDPETSTTLENWTPLTATPTGVSDEQRIEMSISIPIGPEPRNFLRLGVRRTP